MKRVCCLALLALSTAAFAQDDLPRTDERPVEPARGQPAFLENIGKMLKAVQSLGPWEENYEQMMTAMETVFERNGWTSEADQFSLDLIRTVEAIPPFQMQERFDTMVGMLSDRYMLDEQQEKMLRKTLIRESTGMMQQHSGRIMQYAMEAIQTRAAGEPFTADQVARWAEIAAPVFEDGRRRVNIVAKEFMQHLDEQQMKIASTDLDAANHRLNRMGEMREQWAAGNWTASDWGLERDPIQTSGEQRRAAETASAETDRNANRRAAEASGSTAPTPEKPESSSVTTEKATKAEKPVATRSEPTDPWARYVSAFIRKFGLDAGQQDRAWSIHDAVKPRVDQLERKHTQRLAALRGHTSVSAEDRAKVEQDVVAKHDAELERLFYQMNRRLERLPSTVQKRNADKSELPLPIKSVARTLPAKADGSTNDQQEPKK
ncbi:MAG: hypothetical protein JNG88_01335 [Phycisphaerales bacterium]|nr:hypothetical protein [Phycisphaerales bacterium]